MEAAEGSMGHGPSVLVVDDEPDLVWVLRYNLEVDGLETYVARDGAAALEALRTYRPDLMLLDVMMPVMDGWAVLEEVSKMDPTERPKIVVVSARASIIDRARATDLGVDAFVAKPFEMDELVNVVKNLLPTA